MAETINSCHFGGSTVEGDQLKTFCVSDAGIFAIDDQHLMDQSSLPVWESGKVTVENLIIFNGLSLSSILSRTGFW